VPPSSAGFVELHQQRIIVVSPQQDAPGHFAGLAHLADPAVRRPVD
jgi:hypothetical protein